MKSSSLSSLSFIRRGPASIVRGRCKDLVLTWRGVGDFCDWRSSCPRCLLHGLTCIRRSARQPTVPPNRRRATSRRGQMGTYYMKLSPGTNPGGLIRLCMIIDMMWPVSHSCEVIHNVCGTDFSRSDRHPSPWACGVALLMVRHCMRCRTPQTTRSVSSWGSNSKSKLFTLWVEVTLEVVYLGASNSKFFILGVEAKNRTRRVPHAYDLERDQDGERHLSHSSLHVFIVEQIPTWFEATLLIISLRSLSFQLQCRSLRKRRK